MSTHSIALSTEKTHGTKLSPKLSGKQPASPEVGASSSRNITFDLESLQSRTVAVDMATPPALHVQRPSNDSNSLYDHANGNEQDDAGAKWHCCKCDKSTPILIRPCPHPLGALACECPHKPCGSCKTTGQVKPFLPMEEPAMVPLAEVTKEIRFGVLCSCCGLSWRAEETGRYKKTLRKMPSLGISMGQIHQKRLAPANGYLRKSKSTLVLGNKRIITPPGQTVEKQAQYASVKFSEIECTCGIVIDLSTALCFQIVPPPVEEKVKEPGKVKERKKSHVEGKKVGWTTTPELQAKGYGQAIIRIRGIEHPNPLRSNPITVEDVPTTSRVQESPDVSGDQEASGKSKKGGVCCSAM
ncbi:hypothetical protein K458DRAFT_417821 [Lentithecium fluviatile CBS 122367]|uniref:Probable double zinc ribbon domain-containing protein n=1 Tax=Lentithecium fluviatile CBS 122367 TaxID=1168545 RepID=A0A6G1J446_9PLEO|nr:hypothetical protein K458DRAFT_417821 [Lentithecium fluviatile CBS 122367]